jgi:hypothetical protein
MLENLRYRNCTKDDVDYIGMQVAGRDPSKPKLAQKKFRDVSIITGLNVQRDRINELGVEQFAREHGEALHTFYSHDTWKGFAENGERRTKRNVIDPICSSDAVTLEFQEKLWELSPLSTEQHAGKLQLCKGLPVIVKKNEATECCVTNGAEGTVVGWKLVSLSRKHDVLQTVFVKLMNPPFDVQLDGLPVNVVPISAQTIDILCNLPNDSRLSIARLQVPVLPNFAMTDYASQGRTRAYNVVDPENCKSHQSLYTCLSRSSTSEGTILVQKIDEKKMIGGLLGYLRQEFRELELLEEITKIQFDGGLPGDVCGVSRNEIIRSFQRWKSSAYVSMNVHKAISWSISDPLHLEETEVSSWELLNISGSKSKITANEKDADLQKQTPVVAEGSILLPKISDSTGSSKKRKHPTSVDVEHN